MRAAEKRRGQATPRTETKVYSDSKRHTDKKRLYSDSERYIDGMHRLGRIGTLGAILIMLGMPTLLGIHFHALPPFEQAARAAIPLLMVFVPSSFIEVLSYTPIMGSAIYLTLMTGEVLNLKLPVINSALKVMNAEPGTEDADIIATIAVSAAAFVTIAIVTVGVLLAMPLQPFLTLPAVKTAAANILPALFGALLVNALGRDLGGGIRARGRFKGLLPSLIAIVLLVLFDRQISVFFHLDKLAQQEGSGVIMTVFQGFVIIGVLPVSYFCTRWLYKKGRIQVSLPGEAGEAPTDPIARRR